MIDKFDGTKYGFLSNFYECDIVYDGLAYGSTEAAYQAAKTFVDRSQFTGLSPAQSKRLGQAVPLRSDWEDVKDDVMFEVVLQKFTRYPELAKRLLATGDEELVEGNTWGDRYWGVVDGVGRNQLGKTLMRVRAILRNIVNVTNEENGAENED